MRVEVINTGTELLLGAVINSHLAFFGREILPLGLRIERQVTVPDGGAIADALREAFPRCEVLFVTGGLGPTTDDVTRDVVAELLGLELVEDPGVLSQIAGRFACRGLAVTARVNRQAQVPRGATVLPNRCGTAPGLYLAASPGGTPHIFLLPGPPRELHPMFTESVRPILCSLLPDRAGIACRTFRVTGLGESTVESLIGEQLLALAGLELGYCARPGEVDVRCIGADAVLDRAEAILRDLLHGHLLSDAAATSEESVVAQLRARELTLATAESCTGGLVSHRLTNVPGASEVFIEGFVTYANAAKIRQLEVDATLIEAQGAVSAAVAQSMAANARRIAGADFALSLTGIAGPGGGTPEKPVGTVFIGLAHPDGTAVERHNFSSDRETFKQLAATAALNLLRRHLEALP